MDLPRLQLQFTRYLQSLLAMGYLDRSDFRPLYVASVCTSGLPREYISIFRDCTNATLRVMEQALAGPRPDFPMVVAMADDLLSSSARLGASRIRTVVGYISICAATANEEGCHHYLNMTRLEHEALLYVLSVIKEMETSILGLGGMIPLDW